LLSKLALIIGVIAASFGGCSLTASDPLPSPENRAVKAEEKRGTSIGDLAPEFQLARFDSGTISSSELNGKPAVLVFWTAWCPICKEEAPQINKLVSEFEPKGVQVIGINIGESDARIKEGVRDFGIKYVIAKDKDASVAKSYRVVGTPTVVFLDKSGRVQYFGNEVPKDYSEKLEKLISG
jgi:peroxiredoxin